MKPTRFNNPHTLVLVLAIAALCIAHPRNLFGDQSITVRSGNGSIGSQDSLVRVLPFNTTGDITPTVNNFTAAQTAPFAYIDPPYGTYIQSLPADASANWIAVGPNLPPGSALFAIPFQVTDSTITSGMLDIHFAVDNAVNGVFFNGQRISGNSYDGDYHAQYDFVRDDIGPLLIPNATNWLYVNMSDYGGLAGLIFNATITTQGGGTQNVSPDHGGNAGSVTTSILHPQIQLGATVKLTSASQPDIVGNFSTVSDLDNTKELITTFDLTGAVPGVRDIEIAQPDNTTLKLTGAFAVEQGGSAQLSLNVLGPSRVRLGRQATFDALVKNEGNIDAEFVLLGLSAPGLITGLARSAMAQAATPSVMAGFGAIPPGGIGNVTGTIGLNLPGCIPAVANENQDNRGVVCQLLEQLSEQLLNDINNIKNVSIPAIDRQLTAGNCWSFPDSGNCPDLFRRRRALLQQLADLRRRRNGICRQLEAYCGITCQPESASSASIVGPVKQSSGPSSSSSSSQVSIDVCAVTSVDPNDKIGLDGVGAERYLRSAVPLPYTILFENLATATAPAAQVIVTDQLDPNIDPSTFSLQSITFGGVSVPFTPTIGNVNTFVDLRPQKNLVVEIEATVIQGLVTVKFSSVDPDTGLPPSDPTAGFLPPNVNPPEGEGSLFFVVSPKKDLATGTQIRNQAVVVFDSNAPISTPVWSNTIDNSSPTSKVSSLLSTQTSYSFNVQWSGTDDGSGIQDFTIYVSDNDGPFTPWLTQTTASQSTYNGAGGHTYGFYSIARDAVGNLENLKSGEEAKTRVVVDMTPPLITPQVAGDLGSNGWYRGPVTVDWTVADSESGIGSSKGCSTTTLITDTAGSTITCSATNGAGLSSSVSVTIKIDQTPPIISGMPVAGCEFWAPGHKLVRIARVSAADASSGPALFSVTGSSNEPNDPNDRDDIKIEGHGLEPRTIYLRANTLGHHDDDEWKRSDRRDDRDSDHRVPKVYTLTAMAVDLAGNTATATSTCAVRKPLNRDDDH